MSLFFPPEWVKSLKMTNQGLWEKSLLFLQNLSKEDRVAVFYDDDGDGVSAAGVTVAAIIKLRGRPPEIVQPFGKSDTYISLDLPEMLKRMQITKFIALDKAVDQMGQDFVDELGSVCSTIVIDHHSSSQSHGNENVLIVKPHFVWETESASFPTAILSFTLFSSVVDLPDKDWVACIGVTSDSSYPRWKNFVDKALEKYSLPPVNNDPFHSAFGVIDNMIFSVNAVSPSQLPEFLGLLVEAKHPSEVIQSGFYPLLKLIEDETQFWMDKLETEIVSFPELELFVAKIRPRHPVKSLVINRLSRERYPNKTVLLFQKIAGEKLLVSARRQDYHVPMNALLEETVKGLSEATGGGHVPAAAAMIRLEDEELFLEKVKKIIREKYLSTK